MNQKIILLGTVLALVSLSAPFIISFTSGGTIHYTQDIDPRILEVTDDFVIDSTVDIFTIYVMDKEQSLEFRVNQNSDGHIDMDDLLPILQKLFPDKDIVSFAVLADGVEIPYTLEDGKLGISVNYNTHKILITGLSEI